MNRSDCFSDICYWLGEALFAEVEPPLGWRPLGEAIARVPGIRGALIAVWDEAGQPPALEVGELPCASSEVLAAVRTAAWQPRSGRLSVPAAQVVCPSVVAAPLGSLAHPRGCVGLASDDPEGWMAQVVEMVAGGLSTALRFRELECEAKRVEGSIREQMLRMDELAAVSQLAASVAHELRNPLSSIKGAAQYLRNEYGDQTTVREFLDIILEEVGVLSRITTEFLDFARPMHLNLHQGHLHDVISRLLQVMKPQMVAQGIESVVDLAADVPPTAFDPQQIDHVLRNVVFNAVQAMPQGGTLAVRTRYVLTPLPAVDIAVSDTGRGIPAEDLGKLFTPFFTTKAKGVGLGLTIVQKIVENHGGTISVESQAGSGSTFTIRLPSAPGAENLRVGLGHPRSPA